ncbi:MAG: autotransporter domain-containing protein, partial [Acidimicrobiaceae bacterium]|nr:autotransporter domain-containing protein [Acidimicrobiaceae bacterium]
TTGMSYSYDQQAVHGHITAALSDRSSGWIGLRQVNGETNVSIASGSSRLKMRGFGMYGGLHVMGENDLYGQAQLMGTRYRTNLSSGPVSAATKGMAWSFALEGGRHFSVNDETRVTGRGWLKQSNVSINPFRGTDNILVIARERQTIAGVGVRAERTMALASESSRVVLRGSAGIENAMNEASGATIGDVALESQAKATRFLLDLGGALYQGNTTVQGMVYAHGLGADDTAYGLRLGLEWSF